jgi:hypothetical protein
MTRRLPLAALLLVCGCAEQQVIGSGEVTRPPEARHSRDEAFGYQAIVRTENDLYRGELVACDSSFIYLYLNVADSKPGFSPYAMVRWEEIKAASVRTPSAGGVLILWTVLGGLSTLSQGAYLLFGGIAWSAVAPASIVWANSHGRVSGTCNVLTPYTRYPQGLPESMLPSYGKRLPVPTPVPTPAAPIVESTGFVGTTTRLSVHEPLSSRRLDGPTGKTTLVLTKNVAGAGPFATLEWDGDWAFEVYSPAIHAYVLSLHGTVGAWSGIVALRYLDETGAVRDSLLNDAHWIALARVASPDGRAVAFIGQKSDSPTVGGFRLELLDVPTDSLADLGPPPDPPPLPEVCNGAAPRVWGDDTTGRFTPMDPGIIEIAEDRLKVSYGADTCAARSATRTTKEWPLDPAKR